MIPILLQLFGFFLLSDCRSLEGIKSDPNSNLGLFEGDILVDDETRFFTDEPGHKWPNFIIPYQIHSNLANNQEIITNIQKAVAQYHNYTCLKFVSKGNADQHYITIQNGTGCNSYIGRTPWKTEQVVNLQIPDCEPVGTVVHELGHAIGLHHEHKRPDRDNYIFIYKENIGKKWWSAFEIPKGAVAIVGDYHYDSIMHYGDYAFTINGKRTIKAKNGQVLLPQYKKPGLTVVDMIRINTFYDCPPHVNHPRV